MSFQDTRDILNPEFAASEKARLKELYNFKRLKKRIKKKEKKLPLSPP